MTVDPLLRWIPFLPLLAAVIHGLMLGLFRVRMPRWGVIGLSCGSVLLAFLFAAAGFFRLVGLPGGESLVDPVYTWIGSGIGDTRLTAEVAFRLDPLSSVMTLVVSGVGFLIHVYSIGYMDDDERDDRGFQRFFCYLNLFTFAMLVLVLADNLVLMFLGWEGVGLCSYLLIGFWYADRHNAYCGSKAFIVNRIGDFGFLIGIFLVFAGFAEAGLPASLSFGDLQANLDVLVGITVPAPFWGDEWRLVEVAGICFFVGACGKSAQLPLYVWLPDAMAGPTPVSALIHAATMVTAGVYMVCRLAFLYAEAPLASALVAWTGGVTALFAASIAIAQTDIKKVLAYSTVSQLGYMFVAAGCGGYTGAIFHLVTHAFFKALLFLGAGAVILAMHHEQDIDKMGGLGRRIYKTKAVFLIGVFAIAGFPPFSGFFSKDEILLTAWASQVPGGVWLYAMGLVTAALTSFYMWRLHFRVFWGECRAPASVRDHIAEPANVILFPLYGLAVLALLGGVMGIPQVYGDWMGVESSHSLNNFLSGVFPAADPHVVSHALEYGLAGAAVLAATLGLGLSYFLYVKRPELPGQLVARARGLHALLVEKYYVDELYDAVLVRPLVWISDRVLFRGVDAGLIDGLAVNGSARGIRAVAENGLKYLQSGLAQSYLFLMLVGTAAILVYLVGY